MESRATKLVLSADFALKETSDLLNASLLETYPELRGQYALVDNFQDTTYLINGSIYNFLLLFAEPASLHEIYNKLGVDKTTRAQVTRFVKDLRQREILVTARRNAVLKEIVAEEQELPQPEIDPACVVKVLKHTRQVWIGLVRDATRSELYVLKKCLFPPGLPDEAREGDIRDFCHEVAMHKAATPHPKIVDLYDADMETYEMRLQYVEGMSVRKFVKNNNPPLTDRYRLIGSILDIFNHLHSKGILHGDIHSSNFLVNAQKEPMLFDFGMALDASQKKNKGGKMGGVYPYAPPERVSTKPMKIFNRNPTSQVAEVYQLGIIFYLILYHELPFEGTTWKNLSGSILGLAPVWKPKTPAGEDIPAPVINVLQKSLEKDPSDRYASVQEFASVWERVIKSLRTQECN
jgi:Serine/threonine protein kinase